MNNEISIRSILNDLLSGKITIDEAEEAMICLISSSISYKTDED